jgi:hypothetical protein
MDKTYLIDDAAKFIGISRRNFERMNISSREEFREARDGKKRKVRVYDKAELDRVKAERESPSHKPSLVTTTSDNPSSQVVTISDLKVFAEMLLDGLQKETQKLLTTATEEKHKKVLDVSSFKDKQILNFAQTLAYSGLPEDELKRALKNKKITGRKTSEKGTWKIYRISIDEFCRRYFD